MTEWLRFRRRAARAEEDRWPSDARPVTELARRRADDPEARRRLKLRRRALVLGLSGACVAGTLAAIVGEGGYFDLRRLRGQIVALEDDLVLRAAEVERLDEAVRRLESDPAARERIAREQLGLVRSNEVHFLLPRERPADLSEEREADERASARP